MKAGDGTICCQCFFSSLFSSPFFLFRPILFFEVHLVHGIFQLHSCFNNQSGFVSDLVCCKRTEKEN